LFLCIFIDIFSEWISALMKVVVANGIRKCFGFAFSHSFFLTFFFHSLIFSFLDNHFDLLTTEVDFKVSIIFFCVRYFFQFEFFAFFWQFFFNLGRYFSFFMVIFSWVFYNSFFVFDNLGLSFFITFLLIFC